MLVILAMVKREEETRATLELTSQLAYLVKFQANETPCLK